MDTKQKLMALFSAETKDFDATLPLEEQLDSLQLFTMLTLVEKEFSIHFFPIELRAENIRDLDTLTALVDSKLK